jgi:hypothetical protein
VYLKAAYIVEVLGSGYLLRRVGPGTVGDLMDQKRRMNIGRKRNRFVLMDEKWNTISTGRGQYKA